MQEYMGKDILKPDTYRVCFMTTQKCKDILHEYCKLLAISEMELINRMILVFREADDDTLSCLQSQGVEAKQFDLIMW